MCVFESVLCMCICMCVYAYIYIYVCVCKGVCCVCVIHLYMCVGMYVCVCICIMECVCMYVCMYVCTQGVRQDSCGPCTVRYCTFTEQRFGNYANRSVTYLLKDLRKDEERCLLGCYAVWLL
jgi:hypothetical protein